MKNTGNETIESVRKLLGGKPGRLVVVPHENPDGDAIGSAIGLGEVLRNFGHKVKIISPNEYPAFLKWFSASVEVLIYEKQKKEAKKEMEDAAGLICLDFNEPKRAGWLEKKLLKFAGPKILIDHHPNPSSFADHLISETHYSSTAELIFDVIKKTGLTPYLNQAAAEALYTGIMTDTGSFSHNISNPYTFRVIAELMEYGIDVEKIQSNVYHNFSAERMKLLGHALSKKMKVFTEYRTAIISLSQKELQDHGFQPGDTEGFVNYPLSVNNIIFSALFIEKKDMIKASFRSKGTFPANDFAREHFEGGGHRNAAGGESQISMEDTIEKFTQLLGTYRRLLLETI